MKKISSNSSPQNNPTSTQGCFSNIFQNFVCAGNLPTHPSLPDQKFPEKSDKFATFSHHQNNNVPYNIIEVKSRVQGRTRDQTQTQTRTQTQASPGIIAKLMGLESLPPSNNDFLFRSKSLNALHFLPDFDPTRAAFQHRRTRTSASFHEQGHGNSRFLAVIDENLEHNDGLKGKASEMGRRDSKQQRKENKEKGVVSKKNEQHRRCKRDRSYKRYDHEEGYGSSCDSESKLKCNNVGGGSKNNLRDKNAMQKKKLEVNNKEIRKVNVGPSKKRVDHKKENLNVELNDGLSRSPVSVLGHQQGLFDSPTKDDESRQVTSNSRRKSSPKIKIYDDMPSKEIITKSKKNDLESNKIGSNKGKLRKTSEGEVAEYFAELLGQICKLTEENLRDSKWMGEYEGCKVHFMEEICVDIGEEMLDFLLNELMEELVE